MISTEDQNRHAASIVAGYVRRNPLSAQDVGVLITLIKAALRNIGAPPAVVVDDLPRAPAVSIKKSITADYLICLEDGARCVMLKTYLKRRFDMTPADYRQRWGLPGDYPMIPPSHSARRAETARANGLSKKPAAAGKIKKGG